MRRALLVVTLVVTGHLAVAQDPTPFANVDRETALRLTRIVDSARAHGLPTEPIVAKISQGALFHSSPERIVSAAQSVATRLEEARSALAPKPTPADVVAGGDALGVAGVTKTALQAVRATSPNRPVVVPLAVLAQLVASKIPVSRATEIVTGLIKRGATNEQLVALGNDVTADIVRGARAIASLDVRLQGLNAVLAPGAVNTTTSDPVGLTSGSGPKKP